MDNLSLRIACSEANVHHKQYLTWKKEFLSMMVAKNLQAKSQCVGRSSVLQPIEDELL